MDGLDPELGSVNGSPDPLCGHTSRLCDSTDQWVWCLIHMRSMLHVISVICLV
jgi:hypothetical protein